MARYFVDSEAAPGADGLSEGAPLSSAVAANDIELMAGDELLYRRGRVYTANLRPRAHGEQDRPVTIGAYGDGPPPLFDHAHSGEAGEILDCRHLVVRDLTILRALRGMSVANSPHITWMDVEISETHDDNWSIRDGSHFQTFIRCKGNRAGEPGKQGKQQGKNGLKLGGKGGKHASYGHKLIDCEFNENAEDGINIEDAGSNRYGLPVAYLERVTASRNRENGLDVKNGNGTAVACVFDGAGQFAVALHVWKPRWMFRDCIMRGSLPPSGNGGSGGMRIEQEAHAVVYGGEIAGSKVSALTFWTDEGRAAADACEFHGTTIVNRGCKRVTQQGTIRLNGGSNHLFNGVTVIGEPSIRKQRLIVAETGSALFLNSTLTHMNRGAFVGGRAAASVTFRACTLTLPEGVSLGNAVCEDCTTTRT